MSEIIVIGHKSPDTDSVVSAIAAATFFNRKENTQNYIPAITANVNSETQFVLSKFDTGSPQIITNAEGKKLFLVDHNEQSQWVDGAQSEQILGFIDHHKIKFECASAIDITTKPWGCTATIISNMFDKEEIQIPENLKGLLLCAILSDTVILKSPTTTDKDKETVERLASKLNIDYQELGMEMFKAKAQVASKTPEEIIKNDFKDFEFAKGKVGVGQIETPDLSELDQKIVDIIAQMKTMVKEDNYHATILMLTDIIQEGTKLIVVSETEEGSTEIANFFNTKIANNITDFIPGMMSRKKQVAPVLTEKLS